MLTRDKGDILSFKNYMNKTSECVSLEMFACKRNLRDCKASTYTAQFNLDCNEKLLGANVL